MKSLGAIPLVVCAGLALAPSARAQESPWRIGLRGGVNVAHVERSGWPSASPSTSESGPIGGLVAERRVTGPLWLESGLWLLERRASGTGVLNASIGESDPVAVPFAYTDRLRYAEIPLLLKARFGSGTWRPWVAAGPAFDFRISGQSDWTLLAPLPNGSQETSSGSLDDALRASLVAFQAAGGVEARLGDGTALHLEVRWSPGVNNLLNSNVFPGYFDDTRYLRSDDVRILSGVSIGL